MSVGRICDECYDVKLMKDEAHWKQEKDMRKSLVDLDSDDYVVGQLKDVPSDKVIKDNVIKLKGRLDTIRKHLPDNVKDELNTYVYAFIMEAADRNLQQIYVQERPDLNRVRTLLQQLFEAVREMHKKKLMRFINLTTHE